MQQTHQPHTPHMEPRVSRLESVVEGLDGDIQALSSNFDRMAKNTSDSLQRVYDIIERQSTQFNNSISVLQTTLAGSGKANWPVMLSACGLVLAISATVGSLAMQPWKDRHVSLEDRVFRHEQMHGSQYVETVRALAELTAAQKTQGVSVDLHYQMNQERIKHVQELISLKGIDPPGLPAPGPGTPP